MANFAVQAQWIFPSPLLNTTEQSAAEINDRYQGIANCAEFIRVQSATLRTAATALLAEVDAALNNFTSQQSTFNTLGVDAGNKVATATSTQNTAINASSRMAANNTALTTARGKLTSAESNADAVISNGLIRNGGNLDAIAVAVRANPGILGVSLTGTWTWYSAPSGNPFVIEFQVFSTEYGPTANGGIVAANSWNLTDINLASYGSFKNNINFPENLVEETNDRLYLKPHRHYWQVIFLGSNTDAMRARFLVDGAGVGRSLSTQMVADSNTNILRQWNVDSIVDEVLTPTVEPTFLQFQTYHNSVNPAISTAGRGVSGNKGIVNVYMVGYGWRVRNI